MEGKRLAIDSSIWLYQVRMRPFGVQNNSKLILFLSDSSKRQ